MFASPFELNKLTFLKNYHNLLVESIKITIVLINSARSLALKCLYKTFPTLWDWIRRIFGFQWRWWLKWPPHVTPMRINCSKHDTSKCFSGVPCHFFFFLVGSCVKMKCFPEATGGSIIFFFLSSASNLRFIIKDNIIVCKKINGCFYEKL